MCHLSDQADQVLGMAASATRIIMDQMLKSGAPSWCKGRLEIQTGANTGLFG
jgi:hypothetical protein